jgi:hypothetical protein
MLLGWYISGRERRSRSVVRSFIPLTLSWLVDVLEPVYRARCLDRRMWSFIGAV